MLKKELAAGIVQYTFSPQNKDDNYGDNIIAIIYEDKAILIDTGFEDEVQQVIEDLFSSGITIDKVIISHFHDDHMEGLKLLPNATVYGSSRFQETLDMWTAKEEHKYFTPVVVVDVPTIIKFGSHILEIIPSAGHSACTVLVNINGQFLHVADEIMYSPDGQSIIPSIDSRENIKRQLESWNIIKDYSALTIIPGHGAAFYGSKLQADLQNRVAYAEAILAAGENPITYEEAVRKCNCRFLHSEWFDDLAK